jgi:uncharacterized protein
VSELPTGTPYPTPETQPFWDAAAEGRLSLPRCDDCGDVIWYPRRFCPSCHSWSVSWFDATGRGTIYSYTVVRKARGPWGPSVPFVVAYVELDEGPRIMTNIVDCDPDEVRCGQPVEVTFDPVDEGEGVLYRFRPA